MDKIYFTELSSLALQKLRKTTSRPIDWSRNRHRQFRPHPQIILRNMSPSRSPFSPSTAGTIYGPGHLFQRPFFFPFGNEGGNNYVARGDVLMAVFFSKRERSSRRKVNIKVAPKQKHSCLFRKGRTMAEKDSATAIRGGLAEQTGGK